MNSGKRAIIAGLAAGALFAIALFSTAHAVDSPLPLLVPGMHHDPITTVHPDGKVTPPPLSAVVVTNCGLAVALFIQLDATHLMRADPRQSDMFTAVDGKMVQSTAGPMPWEEAYKLAQAAVLSSHVVIPCTDTTA